MQGVENKTSKPCITINSKAKINAFGIKIIIYQNI